MYNIAVLILPKSSSVASSISKRPSWNNMPPVFVRLPTTGVSVVSPRLTFILYLSFACISLLAKCKPNSLILPVSSTGIVEPWEVKWYVFLIELAILKSDSVGNVILFNLLVNISTPWVLEFKEAKRFITCLCALVAVPNSIALNVSNLSAKSKSALCKEAIAAFSSWEVTFFNSAR